MDQWESCLACLFYPPSLLYWLRKGNCHLKNMLMRSNECKKNVKTEWKDDGIRERTEWLQIPLKQKKGNDKCSISTKKRRERKKIMQHDIAKKTGIKESTHNEPLRLLTGDEINLLSRGFNYIPTPATYGSHIRKVLITRCGQEGKSIQRYSVACLMNSLDCALFLDPMMTWLQVTQS